MADGSEQMSGPDAGSAQWLTVDEGWGRRAVDFATLSEPGNCREYVTVHHLLGVDTADRLLDVACGSGLRWSWPDCAAPAARASMPRPGWSR
jgi:hypothetical protein